jgi:hypothetical protein
VKLKIDAKHAKFGRNLFDSQLDLSVVNAWTNARLVLSPKIKLVFVGTTDTHISDRVVRRRGKTFARDADGNLFPIVDWVGPDKDFFSAFFRTHSRGFWSWKFTLSHVRSGYAGLDKMTDDMGSIRPNVDCLLHPELVDKDWNKKINVFKIDPTATSFITARGRQGTITNHDAPGFRSDSDDYIEQDMAGDTMRLEKSEYAAADWQSALISMHEDLARTFVEVHLDTIAHEMGHAIGQQHIMDLKYNKNRAFNGNSRKAYRGKTVQDSQNVEGFGDLIGPENAISWLERLAQHMETKTSDWKVTMGYVAPRQLSLLQSIGL